VTRPQLKPPIGPEDHAQGPADAPVTLVEYGDYECPHCGLAFPVIQRVQEHFGDRLRFVFRNFPLSEVHTFAAHAAESAESAGAQGGEEAFWAMHDAIYTHQQDGPRSLSDEALARYAADAGVDGRAVLEDLRAQRFAERVQRDFMSGVRSGVNGTPTFFVNGVRYDGNWTDADAFAADLEAAARAG